MTTKVHVDSHGTPKTTKANYADKCSTKTLFRLILTCYMRSFTESKLHFVLLTIALTTAVLIRIVNILLPILLKSTIQYVVQNCQTLANDTQCQ